MATHVHSVYVRLEHFPEQRIRDIGPFAYVQVTRSVLRAFRSNTEEVVVAVWGGTRWVTPDGVTYTDIVIHS